MTPNPLLERTVNRWPRQFSPAAQRQRGSSRTPSRGAQPFLNKPFSLMRFSRDMLAGVRAMDETFGMS